MEDPLLATAGVYCRFCAKQKPYAELLDLEGDFKTKEEYMKIIKNLQITYLDFSSNDKLPKTTCELCHDLFKETYEFFIKSNLIHNRKCHKNEYFKSTHSEELCKECSQDTNAILCGFCEEAIDKERSNNLSIKKKSLEYNKILNFFNINSCLYQKSCLGCYQALHKGFKFLKCVKKNQDILNKIINNMNTTYYVKTECGSSDDESLNELKAQNIIEPISSWNLYPWQCCHCSRSCKNLDDLRSHSKDVHSMCNALKCTDCGVRFETFHDFVVHVQQHRSSLNLHCQYCNESFATAAECLNHVNTHYKGTQKICVLCGEMLPFENVLQWHIKFYGRGTVAEEEEIRSWTDYSWMCQECSLPFPDASSLRAHAQATHDTCFAIKCADCDKEMKQFKLFVAHVVEHRPYLAKYCQYCNEHFDSVTELNQHILRHITSQQRPCNICGQIFSDNHEMRAHKATMKKLSKRKTPTVACVASKGIKTENIVKRRRKALLTNEDLTCKQCLKVFVNHGNLLRHLVVHREDRPRNYVCKVCGAAFFTSSTLYHHAKKHNIKSVLCEFCKKEFHTTHQLKNHIITHSEARPYVCDECGNSFKTKRRLKSHLVSHTDIKPFKCMYCFKDFRFKENLKTHQYQHTGARPYSCENCDRTFTNWTNCNKHMIRKHGLTLARTKITPKGRMEINRRTGELKNFGTDVGATEWLDEMIKNKRPYKNSDI